MTSLLLSVAITLLIAVLYKLDKLRGYFMPNDFTVLNEKQAELATKLGTLKTAVLTAVQGINVQPQIDTAVAATIAAIATVDETITIATGIVPPPPPTE